MTAEAIRRALRGRLALPLPGREAQRAAWPDGLPQRDDLPSGLEYGPAAVLIALFPEHGIDPPRFGFPLIHRPGGSRRHAGQISLPGGECGPDEDSSACAVREAEEEVGLPAGSVEVLGFLTPVPVPVSRYRIQPVVGWIAHPPDVWTPQPEEVDGIFTADPDLLLAEGPRGRLARERERLRWEVPCYLVPDPPRKEATVWGATAIILAEFLEVWRAARERAGA